MRRKASPPPADAAARPLVPPRRVFVGLVSLVAATLMVRAGLLEAVVGPIVDQAVRNIITLILGFSAVMSVVVWFLFESGHSATRKRRLVAAIAGLVLLGLAMLRIERVSGDLVPEFAWRWTPPRDRRLADAAGGAARTAGESREPWQATADDFPRFLGPDGTCGIDRVALDPDWQARPPRLVWRRPIGAGWSGFATCGDHAVTLEQRGDEEIVSCRSATTGDVEWEVAVRARHETVLGGVGPRSTPTIRDGVVYATGATGWLHAIDGATGRVVWKKDVVADLGIDPADHAQAVTWGRSASPLVTDEVVIVPGGGPLKKKEGGAVALVAYDRSTGDRRWTAGGDQISYATPAILSIAGRETLVAVHEARVVGYDPATRVELWQFDWPGHSNSNATCSQAVAIGGRRLLVSKGYGEGAAVFELPDGGGEPRELWRQKSLLKTKFTNLAIHDGHAYGLSDGILECVRLDDGRRRWKGGRYGQGQVLRVGDLLLVQAESGDVVLVECNPAKHVERATLAAIAGQTWNNLCLAGNRLLVRNAEEAACHELPLSSAAAATP
jgi:outer membrane protein assembly factor BamB